MTFFSKFFIKTQYSHAHIWSKNVNSVKTTLFMVIKVNRMLFLFRFFTKKSLLSCPYFIKNTSILLKHTALIPILVKKTSILSKTRCSHVIFFKFFITTCCCHAHIWSKNVNSVKTTLYCWEKKNRLSGEWEGEFWAFVAAFGIKITIYYRNGRFFHKIWAWEHSVF